MSKIITWPKIRRKVWSKIVSSSRKTGIYYLLYRSYWHHLFNSTTSKSQKKSNFFSARPNPGAGIGHQIANWIAGYWFAKQFDLLFAHIPFSTYEWEKFLGFGENEKLASDLIKTHNYKKVRLPLFDEYNSREVLLIKDIISSYEGKNIVFTTEQDQFYKNQFGVMSDIQIKFHNSASRVSETLIYSQKNCNVAVHIRRGDITLGQKNNNPGLTLRWQEYDYFINILSQLPSYLKTTKPIYIYLFSQGNPEDFQTFSNFQNLKLCLDMNAKDSFLHMVNADVLITSKSSFSYKPALLNRGLKICPKNFWHGYPLDDQWILCNESGTMINPSVSDTP